MTSPVCAGGDKNRRKSITTGEIFHKIMQRVGHFSVDTDLGSRYPRVAGRIEIHFQF
jgi:hypothetical protein